MIEVLQQSSIKSVLLQVCCAPCATSSLQKLEDLGYEVILYFYNPNIQPHKEYLKRLDSLRKFANLKKIKLLEGEYQPKKWIKAVKSQAFATETSRARCKLCYRERLEATAKKAKELQVDAFTTTLTVSPYKDSKLIFKIGSALAEEFNTKFLEIDFKKQDGYKKSILLSQEYDLYRQNYCGCIYSLLERSQIKPYN